MAELNERQKKVIQLHMKNGLPKYKAYMEVYGVNEETARSSSARMFAKDSVKAEVDVVRENIQADADWAYQELKTLYRDPKTPAAEKAKILQSIISRSGLDAAQKVEQTNIQKNPFSEEEINDILANAYERKQAGILDDMRELEDAAKVPDLDTIKQKMANGEDVTALLDQAEREMAAIK